MLEPHDVRRLASALDDAAALATRRSLFGPTAGPDGGADDVERDPTFEDVIFDHVGLLVFPETHESLVAHLTDIGLRVERIVPSVIVRDRLARRHRARTGLLDVRIVHARSGRGANLEVFSLELGRARSIDEHLAEQERESEAERHSAFRVPAHRLGAVREALVRSADLVPDGAGFNPAEDHTAGGRTVLYFAVDPDRAALADGQVGPGHRLELLCSGHHDTALAAHEAETPLPGAAQTELLSLLSGHWAARAIHTAAELGIVDALERPSTPSDVAARLDLHPDATARLLAYLARLGLVRLSTAGLYTATRTGRLLRRADPFHDLTRFYGGEVYDAWEHFPQAIRAGGTAFRSRFGTEHFAYLSERPERARTFDRAMEAVTRLVGAALADAFDLEDDATVVDVGGGNGTLLQEVLRTHPDARGTVVDLDHVIRRLQPPEDLVGRLSGLAGDFFAVVPAVGDVYLLSRVLHDWDDEDCVRILTACRDTCPEHAQLLVLERLLPEDGGPARPSASEMIASAWDMQMLSITGGRERTRADYETLLRKTGFEVSDVLALPLAMNVIVASPFPAGRP